MFLIHSNDTGAKAPWEYLPAAAGTYVPGQLLAVSGGKLAALIAASTTTPPYLCMGAITAAEGDLVPVARVQKGTIYETMLSAEDADAAIGTKLEVSSGGLEADGTAAGSFEVVYLEGTAKGNMVRGRFL